MLSDWDSTFWVCFFVSGFLVFVGRVKSYASQQLVSKATFASRTQDSRYLLGQSGRG
jgi:hypothetical protein